MSLFAEPQNAFNKKRWRVDGEMKKRLNMPRKWEETSDDNWIVKMIHSRHVPICCFFFDGQRNQKKESVDTMYGVIL